MTEEPRSPQEGRMIFEIRHRFTGNILFSLETENLKLCVEAAVNDGANLRGAYLGGANLRGAYLRGAYLDGAYLRGAYLDGAYLDGAYLRGAYLRGANLRGANLDGAYLGGANLDGAYLDGAYLRGAYLDGANLDGAYLYGAYLRGANLRGANLDGANLDGANLDGAYLGGANLDGAKLIGDRPIIQIFPIGLRSDFLTAFITDRGLLLHTGCFFGTVDKFKTALKNTHGDNAHAQEYLAALSLIETHCKLFGNYILNSHTLSQFSK